METRININMSKKDLFNAQNASKDVKEAIKAGQVLEVTGCAVVVGGGTDKQGNPCDVGYIATTDGVYGFISNIMINALESFADILTEEIEANRTVQIRFFAGQSKGGSEYYNFEIL